MKWMMILLLIVVSQSGRSQGSPADLSILNSLTGTWERTNGRPGKTYVEKWEQVHAGEFRGMGFFMQASDTTITERLRIVLSGSDIHYIADVPGNSGPTFFRFTKWETNHFVCENPSHDFPKKIEYQWNDRELKAVISGDGKSIVYLFRKT